MHENTPLDRPDQGLFHFCPIKPEDDNFYALFRAIYRDYQGLYPGPWLHQKLQAAIPDNTLIEVKNGTFWYSTDRRNVIFDTNGSRFAYFDRCEHSSSFRPLPFSSFVAGKRWKASALGGTIRSS